MPTRTANAARSRRGPLRSPLAAAPHVSMPPTGLEAAPDRAVPPATVPDARAVTIEEFRDYLRTVNNRDGRPYEDATIDAYVYPAKALDAWLTAHGLDGDFTTVDAKLLNRYFRDYYRERGQGGTHTQQRNLIQLFNYLQREYGHPSPYAAGLNRYAEVRGRPKTLPPHLSTICSKSPATARRATSRTPATTPSSGSCAAKASAGRNCSAWSCSHSLRTCSATRSSASYRSKAPAPPGKDGWSAWPQLRPGRWLSICEPTPPQTRRLRMGLARHPQPRTARQHRST